MIWREHVDSRGVLDAVAVARVLRAARLSGRALHAPLPAEFELSLDDAYRIQDELTTLRIAAGEHVLGWKLGYTSPAMRAQMGIDAPNFGPLTDAMLLRSGDAVPASALQPRVEPEIGLRIGHRLSGPCTVDEVLAACSEAVACLEVVDSVWEDYLFTLEDNTADGSSAAWVVVGGPLALRDLPSVPVTLSVDAAEVASATGAAAGGHPAAGVAWLAEQLGLRGKALEPGDLVITGGLTAAYPLEPGVCISGTFDGGVTVRVHG